MSIKLITIDCGKANTKIAIADEKNTQVTLKSYPTSVILIDENYEKSGNNTSIVEYDNKAFVVGSYSDDAFSNMNTNSKVDYIHETMARYAIASNVNNGDEINVAITCPYADGLTKEKRDDFKDAILPTGNYSVNINGKTISFKIKNTVSIQEAAAAKFYLKSDGNDLGIIDIGGLNSTFAYYKFGEEKIEDKCGFTRNGIIKLAHNLQENLTTACNTDSIDIADILLAIKERGYIRGYVEETKAIISEALDQLLVDIIKDCQNKKWDLKAIDLVFIGGGSIILKDRIQNKYPEARIVDRPEFNNVLGSMVALRIKSGLSGKFEISN